ncbi:MAG: hypothetical protein LBS62_09955 [Clostridiales bacterium]|nr:hypothetical protein [Clostridiales bacterium]
MFSQELTLEDFREISYRAGVKKGIAEARVQGITKGRIQGIAEGRLQGITKIAVRMLEEGFSIEQISRVTNLPVEKIQKLHADMTAGL